MANLKVYEWEAQRWPEFRSVFVKGRPLQRDSLGVLADTFKIDWPTVEQSRRRGAAQGIGGYYRWGGFYGSVHLGMRSTLATLVHEFAHHLCQRTVPKELRKRAHGKEFKRCLKLSYAAARVLLREARSRTAQGI